MTHRSAIPSIPPSGRPLSPIAPRDAAPAHAQADTRPSADAGNGVCLLQRYRAASPFFMAGPRRTLLVPALGAPVPNGPQPLPQRVAHALRAARDPQARVVGALPFDHREPAALHVVDAVEHAGPIADLVAAPVSVLACDARTVPVPRRYVAAVAEAVRRIRAGEIEKVVLARTLELVGDRPVALPALLTRLAARNTHGYTFAVALPGGRTLMGASPELLVSREGGLLRANPLAGSLPRSADPAEDRRRAEALMASSKDLAEHRVVVEAVAEALRPFCPHLNVPAQPSLLTTQRMWHLSTEITGRTDADALTLALALHPTPAVCGSPRLRAQQLIEVLEPFDRGFYSGALGWSNAQGDGEWVVSLRCAEVAGATMRLFAGAGVVGDSTPEGELAETGAKLRTMLDALCLPQDIEQHIDAQVAA